MGFDPGFQPATFQPVAQTTGDFNGMWSVNARQVVFEGVATMAHVPDDLYYVGSTALGFGAPRLLSTSRLHAPSVKVESSLTQVHRLESESMMYPATVTVEPGPQKIAHDKMLRSLKKVRAALESDGQTRIGHNNPPGGVESAVFTAEQVAALMRAMDTLERTSPAPHTVPEAAREAGKTLARISAEAFAHDMGAQAAQAVGWTLKAGGVVLAAKYAPMLAEAIADAEAWMAIVDHVTKAAGL